MTSRFSTLLAASVLGLGLAACSGSEPTEAEMQAAATAANPAGQDFQKISCVASVHADGHTCEFKVTIRDVTYDATGRFYREAGVLKLDARNTVIRKSN